MTFIKCAAITFMMFMTMESIGFADAVEPSHRVAMPTVSSTLEDQTGLALTIYNVNLGLIKDQRQLRLGKGTGELRFMDVASQIIPIVMMKILMTGIAPKNIKALLYSHYDPDVCGSMAYMIDICENDDLPILSHSHNALFSIPVSRSSTTGSSGI